MDEEKEKPSAWFCVAGEIFLSVIACFGFCCCYSERFLKNFNGGIA